MCTNSKKDLEIKLSKLTNIFVLASVTCVIYITFLSYWESISMCLSLVLKNGKVSFGELIFIQIIWSIICASKHFNACCFINITTIFILIKSHYLNIICTGYFFGKRIRQVYKSIMSENSQRGAHEIFKNIFIWSNMATKVRGINY